MENKEEPEVLSTIGETITARLSFSGEIRCSGPTFEEAMRKAHFLKSMAQSIIAELCNPGPYN